MAKDVESDIEVVRHDGNKDVASSASSNDLDDTYNLYKQQNMDNVDPQEASRVLRRIDYHILPILMMTYMLQYLDKSSINFASVHGLRQGTNLKGQDYSWLGSIFYFGYLVAQYPAGYALQRLPLGKFIGAMILAWGILIITTPACTSFAVIATNRFLLGLFGGTLGYAIGHITSGLPQWMYIFLIFGSISIVWGVVFLISMPDIPSSARFLSREERIVAVERVATNRQGVKNHHFKKYQLWQFLRDPKR
ncbi:hypothetical protein CLAFUW4_07601 [Fulvia fulva]|nr:hypothetical protein CLAFUW4_07601 [Fulvia fulva]WPV31131.1 hypothetical protein CLAFUW7_07603 [Fulvia fulva]